MPVGGAVKLDDVDVKILRCLSRNSRLSLRQLAKIVGVSTQTVSRRLTRLIREGVIQGFTICIDYEKIHEELLTSMLWLQVPPEYVENVIEWLLKQEEVEEVLVTSGDKNVLALLQTRTRKQLMNFINYKLSAIRGINSIELVIVLKRTRRFRGIY